MTNSNDPTLLNTTGTLSLPQNCTPDQRDARKKEVEKNCKEYVFDHSWQGYPPSIRQNTFTIFRDANNHSKNRRCLWKRVAEF